MLLECGNGLVRCDYHISSIRFDVIIFSLQVTDSVCPLKETKKHNEQNNKMIILMTFFLYDKKSRFLTK